MSYLKTRNRGVGSVKDHHGRHGDTDTIYYNCDIVNGRVVDTGSGNNPSASFNETRDMPIIKDASKYDFSIVRFSINGANKSLPLFIPSINEGTTAIPNTNRDLTNYSVSLYIVLTDAAGAPVVNPVPLPNAPTNAWLSTQSIIWAPENTDALVPLAPSANNNSVDLDSSYYYCYTYQHWLDLVNFSFQSCITAAVGAPGNALGGIQTQITAAALPYLIQSRPPQMLWNESTGLFQLRCDTLGWGGNQPTGLPVSAILQGRQLNGVPGVANEDWRLYWNANFQGLFSNFDTIYNGTLEPLAYQVFIHPENIELATDNRGVVAPAVVAPAISGTGEVFYVNSQDYESTSSLWSPIESIVFVSTLLPVIKEQTGQPIRFGDNTNATSTTTASAFQPIVTDMVVHQDTGQGYRDFISYVPSGEYRITSLTNSVKEVQDVDIQVYWKRRLDGNLVPLEMYNLSSISIKMMFRRRSINVKQIM